MATKTKEPPTVKFISGMTLNVLVSNLNTANVELCKLIDSHKNPVKAAIEKMDKITDEIEELADSVEDDEIEDALKENEEKEDVLDALRTFLDSYDRNPEIVTPVAERDLADLRAKLTMLDKRW